MREQGSLVSGRCLKQQLDNTAAEEVWLAEQPDGTLVDVRLPKADFGAPGLIDRFRGEIAVLARIHHGHLAQLLGAGSDEEGAGFYVTEHIEGWPVERYMEELGLGLGARLRLYCQFCSAVAALHEQGLAHGGLALAEVRVSVDGRVKLMDPGVANRLRSDMAPDRLDDVAALGRLLTEFAGETEALPERLRTISSRASERGYADAAQLGSAVEAWLTPTPTAQIRRGLVERLREKLTAGRE